MSSTSGPGSTTHHLQIAKVRMPIRKREKLGVFKAPLPCDIWKNRKIIDNVKKQVPRIFDQLCPELQLPIQQIATLVHFDPINNDNYRDPLLIYFDRAFLAQKASWAFSAVTSEGQIVFERWFAICLDKTKTLFSGPIHFLIIRLSFLLSVRL